MRSLTLGERIERLLRARVSLLVMSGTFEISEAFTERWADAMPIDATSYGIAGREDRCTDYSPEGHASRADLYRSTLEQLEPHRDEGSDVERFGAKVLGRWLEERVDRYEEGEWRRDLNHTYSPFQNMRDVFDVMGKDTVEDWSAIVARLQGFGGMVAGYRETLQAGIDAGRHRGRASGGVSARAGRCRGFRRVEVLGVSGAGVGRWARTQPRSRRRSTGCGRPVMNSAHGYAAPTCLWLDPKTPSEGIPTCAAPTSSSA